MIVARTTPIALRIRAHPPRRQLTSSAGAATVRPKTGAQKTRMQRTANAEPTKDLRMLKNGSSSSGKWAPMSPRLIVAVSCLPHAEHRRNVLQILATGIAENSSSFSTCSQLCAGTSMALHAGQLILTCGPSRCLHSVSRMIPIGFLSIAALKELSGCILRCCRMFCPCRRRGSGNTKCSARSAGQKQALR